MSPFTPYERGPRRTASTKAGPVTITRADGTVAVKPPYTPTEVRNLVTNRVDGPRLSNRAAATTPHVKRNAVVLGDDRPRMGKPLR